MKIRVLDDIGDRTVDTEKANNPYYDAVATLLATAERHNDGGVNELRMQTRGGLTWYWTEG